MTPKLAILGASGHGKVVAEIAELNGYDVTFFDDAYKNKSNLEHWAVVGNTENLIQKLNDFHGLAVAIGNNQIRKLKLDFFLRLGANTPTLIHPSATISRYATIDVGTIIVADAVINAFTKIGKGVIVNTNSSIEHDCVIHDYVHICPGAVIAGGCKICEGTWLGVGSSVRQQIEVGKMTTIGAGSTVLKNIPDNVTAFGSPCVVQYINEQNI